MQLLGFKQDLNDDAWSSYYVDISPSIKYVGVDSVRSLPGNWCHKQAGLSVHMWSAYYTH